MKRYRDMSDHTRELPLSEVYERYVQRLYKYGMHVCEDREFVMDAITRLFVDVRSQGKLLVTGPTLRFCLFKRFRDLISTYYEAPISIGVVDNQMVENSEQSGLDLSRSQREAVFLKLYCDFSYEQVASIMHLDTESSYVLITRAFEILRRQYKNERSATSVYAIQLH